MSFIAAIALSGNIVVLLCDSLQLWKKRKKLACLMQAFIFGLANGEFQQSFLTCRAKICQRSKLLWFHINLKYNDWLKEAMILPAEWFYWEYLSHLLHIHRCNRQLFPLFWPLTLLLHSCYLGWLRNLFSSLCCMWSIL